MKDCRPSTMLHFFHLTKQKYLHGEELAWWRICMMKNWHDEELSWWHNDKRALITNSHANKLATQLLVEKQAWPQTNMKYLYDDVLAWWRAGIQYNMNFKNDKMMTKWWQNSLVKVAVGIIGVSRRRGRVPCLTIETCFCDGFGALITSSHQSSALWCICYERLKKANKQFRWFSGIVLISWNSEDADFQNHYSLHHQWLKYGSNMKSKPILVKRRMDSWTVRWT